MTPKEVKAYANLIKLHFQTSSLGAFNNISDEEFLIQYNGYSKRFIMMIGAGSEAFSIGDWSNLDDKPDEVLIYYKKDLQGNPTPMVMVVPAEEAKKHLKKSGNTYLLDLSKIRSYISSHPERIEKFKFSKPTVTEL